MKTSLRLWNVCPLLAMLCFCGCSNSADDLGLKISHGDRSALEKYIQKGFDVNRRFVDESLLFKALKGGKYDMVDKLLKLGADPNATNAYSATVLMEASGGSRPSIVQLLIKHQADVGKKDQMGYNAVRYAVGGNPENIYLLVLAGANVNNTDRNGETPLITAVDYHEHTGRGYVDIMTLLSLGAKVNCTNSDQATPLSLATKADDTNVIALLLKYQKPR